jgi:hypothetical protein
MRRGYSGAVFHRFQLLLKTIFNSMRLLVFAIPAALSLMTQHARAAASDTSIFMMPLKMAWIGGTMSGEPGGRNRVVFRARYAVFCGAQVFIFLCILVKCPEIYLIEQSVRINWIMLTCALAAAMLGIFFRSLRLRVLLRPVQCYPLTDLVLGSLNGLCVKMLGGRRYLRHLCKRLQLKSGVPTQVSMTYLAMDRLMDYASAAILTVMLCLMGRNAGVFSLVILIIGVTIGIFSFVLFTAGVCLSGRQGSNSRICARSPGSMLTKLRSIMFERLQLVTRPVGRRKQDLPAVILLTLFALSADLSGLWFAAQAVRLSGSTINLIMVYLFLFSMYQLPVFPGLPGLSDVLVLAGLKQIGILSSEIGLQVLTVHTGYFLVLGLGSVISTVHGSDQKGLPTFNQPKLSSIRHPQNTNQGLFHPAVRCVSVFTFGLSLSKARKDAGFQKQAVEKSKASPAAG